MTEDATGSNGTGGEPLARALATAHDALAAKIALLEAEQAAGTLAPGLAAQQAAAAQVVYERSCGLARVEAASPGREAWAGPGGVLYGRRLLTSPPWLVRAPSPQALAEAIHRRETGCSPAAPCTACDPGEGQKS